MRRPLLCLTLALAAFACDSEPEYIEAFDEATDVAACEAPTIECKAEATESDTCGGEATCEAQQLAECERLRAQCRWRIEQPDADFPCPNQTCGEACTALDGTQKACGARFECQDNPVCGP